MSFTSARCFIDTNVLVYALLSSEDPRSAIARRTLQELRPGRPVVSTQVLIEFANVAINKAKRSAAEVSRLLGLTHYADVIIIEPADVASAVQLHESTSISLWDALIVTAAARGGCDVLLTEDLHHDQVIAGVRVENPFKSRKP